MKEIESLKHSLDTLGYVADEELATVLFLMLHLKKPLLLEGHPGVGKTEIANVLAEHLQTELIRLQCYEGLDVHSSIYEWNYQKQLLSIKIRENSDASEAEKEKMIFGKDYILERPLLRAITAKEKAPVLLIDEIDRADEEFEAFLLEMLSANQISIPELGTIKAIHPPIVILTSNRTRELSDALRRRCLYHWVNYPDPEKELKIVRKRLPGIEEKLARQLVQVVQNLRSRNLNKAPGISETLDWAMSLNALGKHEIDASVIRATLGSLLKSNEDIERIKHENLSEILTGNL
ncbi:MAG: MoxR family ATPase [Cyclobacteriaceae bacterium]|jgi:MoxR-like ATPase|nr:MoxR family ATPase [Cyclobacteriaceae bacterium]